jgi:aerobic-type carbon monoxide dehydrogenase small subunit (CoxS/CutS family)
MSLRIRLTLNGREVAYEVEPEERLVETLRERANLTGTKIGCGIGECGACSVLLDGKLICSCLVLTAAADGCSVLTVEGLARAGRLSELQRAFVAEGAVQCGYCTPGMLMAGTAALASKKPLGQAEARAAISGNLCRCTGYQKIENAIRKTARRRAPKRRRK